MVRLVRVSLHGAVGRLTMWYVLRIWSLIAEWSAGDSFDLSQDGELAGRRPTKPTWAADGLARRTGSGTSGRSDLALGSLIPCLRWLSFASERWNLALIL